MKAVCIGDLQGQAPAIDPALIPEGDILLVAGDIGGWGVLDELYAFDNWIAQLPHKHKIVVAGNHDRVLARVDGHNVFHNCTYLQDELIEIEGRKIFGSPVSDMGNIRNRTIFNAFCDPTYIKQVCNKIPSDLDVLLVHGPAFGILDLTLHGSNVGSKDLLVTALDKKPKYVVSGHIHEAHGVERRGETLFVNAALCSAHNDMFLPNNDLYFQPIVIDL